jgi:hypothetical protein
MMVDSAGNLTASIAVGTTPYSVTSSTSVTADSSTWYHLAFTYGANTLKVYIDGQLKGTSTAMTGDLSQVSMSTMCIGTNPLAGNRQMNGTMKDFRVYNYALTIGEIAALV